MQRNKATKKLSVIDKYGLETNILLQTIFDVSNHFSMDTKQSELLNLIPNRWQK